MVQTPGITIATRIAIEKYKFVAGSDDVSASTFVNLTAAANWHAGRTAGCQYEVFAGPSQATASRLRTENYDRLTMK